MICSPNPIVLLTWHKGSDLPLTMIEEEGKKVFDRNYQDRYNDPGSFITEKNNFGEDTLYINNGKLYLKGTGYSI